MADSPSKKEIVSQEIKVESKSPGKEKIESPRKEQVESHEASNANSNTHSNANVESGKEEKPEVHEEKKVAEEVQEKKEEAKVEENQAEEEKVAEQGSPNKGKKNLADSAKKVMKEMENKNFANVYSGAILERKKESFTIFQTKEQQRKALADTHREIVTALVFEIDAKVAWIGGGIDKTVKFFKDRAQQEEEYMKITTTGLSKLGTFFKDPNKPELFPNFSKALGECDEFHVRQSQNSDVLIKFLRKDILEKILASEKEFKKNLDILRSPIEDMKKKFVSLQQERAKKQRAYIQSYNEAQRGGKITKEKDMCFKEIDFTVHGYEEGKLVKGYATQALLLLNEVVKLLITRLTEIQNVLTLYFQKFIDLYGYKASNPESVMQALQRFNSAEEIQQLFAVNNVLTPDGLKYFQDKVGRSDITYQNVFDVLVQNPSVIAFEKGPLILKRWRAQREAGILKGPRQCDVLVTVDGHVLAVDRTQDGEGVENIIVLSLKYVKMIGEKKDFATVEILETMPRILINAKTKMLFRFSNADNAEEFRHYIYNYFNTAALDIENK